jgi:GNAT superfamily N-acetyltransferase
MLNDGTHVIVRPVHACDRDLEADFIKRLSPEARHFRFLGAIREASPTLLDQLVNVDHRNSMAFIALIYEQTSAREVGVSRFSASIDGNDCECAVTIADDWQHRGLAVVLMQHLIDEVRQKGFRTMFSMDSIANEPMRALAQYLGFLSTPDPGDAGQVIYTLDLRHEVRPDGPVICKACASKGHAVEMKPHAIKVPHADVSERSENTELKSYRCPQCEGVSYFRVS